MKFRNLTADEVECRVATCKESGCSLLLYKDARADMKILDETVGAENWQRKHEVVNGNLFCTVSIWDKEKQQWISKEDVGVESFTEKEKGQASDSFKRACVNWNIGRELYTAPFIWIDSNKAKMVNKNGKWSTYDTFEVRDMKVDDGVISELIIENVTQKKVVFTWKKEARSANEKPASKASNPAPKVNAPSGDFKLSEAQIKRLFALTKDSGKTNGASPDEFLHAVIKQKWKLTSLKDLTKEQYEALANWLGGDANGKG